MDLPTENSTVDILPTAPIPTEPPPPFSSLVRVDLAGLSDAGRVRPNNEDHFLITRFGRSLELVQGNLPRGTLPGRHEEVGYGFVVADGMGGHASGEVASQLAIQALVALVTHVPDWIFRIDDIFGEELERRAAERFHQINAVLNEQAEAEPRMRGMGTTMVLAVTLGADMILTSIGDSRAYRYRRGQLRQLTHDHTVAQEMLDAGQVTPKAAGWFRHMLTRVLGGGTDEAEPDIRRHHLDDGDCLLLCTDGLTDMLDDATIAQVLGAGEPAATTCRRLVDLAVERGGKDNVTAIVARFRMPPRDK